MRRPISAPKSASIWSGSNFSPGLTCPPLRPDAPHPTSLASSTRTSTPFSAKCSAADSPVNPAPTTTTSARASPANGGVSGPVAAVSA